MKINNELSRQYRVLKLKKELRELEAEKSLLEYKILSKILILRWLWEKVLYFDRKRWRKK